LCGFKTSDFAVGCERKLSALSCLLCFTRQSKTKPWLPARLPGQVQGSSAKLPAMQRVVIYLQNNDFMSIVESIRWCGFTARAQMGDGAEGFKEMF